MAYHFMNTKMIKSRHNDKIEFLLYYKSHDDAIISKNIAFFL